MINRNKSALEKVIDYKGITVKEFSRYLCVSYGTAKKYVRNPMTIKPHFIARLADWDKLGLTFEEVSRIVAGKTTGDDIKISITDA